MLPWTPTLAAAETGGGTSVGRQPPIHPAAILARAGIEAWVNAVRRARTLDVTAVSRVLETEAAATVLGALRFDLKGDALIPSFAPHRWVEGRWQARAP